MHRIRVLLWDEDILSPQKTEEVLDILQFAVTQPPEYSCGIHDGSITKTNAVPLIVGMISSLRDNPHINHWKSHLLQKYNQVPEGELRSSLALILGLMGETVGQGALRELLKDSNDDALRSLAVLGLSKSGDASVIPDLYGALSAKSAPMAAFNKGKADFYYPLKRVAKIALTNLGENIPQDADVATKDEVVKYLAEVLSENSGGTMMAANSLRVIGGEQAEAELAAYVLKYKNGGSSGKVAEVNEQLKLLKKSANRSEVAR